MSYSYSQLSVLQDCERKWALRYKEGLQQAGPTPWALLRGRAWHAVMAAEAIFHGNVIGTLLQGPALLEVIDDLPIEVHPQLRATEICAHIAEWERGLESDYRDAMVEEYGGLLSDRIWELWTRFSEGRTKDELFGQPLLVEFPWERQMPNGLSLRGITDLVYHDPTTDNIVVRDWKLHQSWLTTPPAIEDLVNSQLHLNAWGIAEALRQLAPNGHSRIPGLTGLVPDSVEYARARFKKPATPVLTKATAKNPPRLAKSTTDYDAYTYREFCASPEAVSAGYQMDEAYYADLTEQRERWFRISRKPLLYNVYSQHVLSAQEQAARAETVTTENSIPVYGSHCGRCEFSSLCRSDLIGGREPYDEINALDYGLKRR